jgi:hypothetical protein
MRVSLIWYLVRYFLRQPFVYRPNLLPHFPHRILAPFHLKMRTSHHAHLKSAVRLGVCPVRVQNQLPKSNIYRWKTELPKKYFSAGLELEKYTRLLETVQMSPGTFYAYARLVRTFINCFVKTPWKRRGTYRLPYLPAGRRNHGLKPGAGACAPGAFIALTLAHELTSCFYHHSVSPLLLPHPLRPHPDTRKHGAVVRIRPQATGRSLGR